MIIVAHGPEEFIEKSKKVIEEMAKELDEIGRLTSKIMVHGRKELLKYKLLGYKVKPKEEKILNEKPRIVLHESSIVLLNDIENFNSQYFKALRDELEELMAFVETRKDQFQNHLFILILKDSSVVSLFILSPNAPNFDKIIEDLKEV
ncbi:hypothetical protein EYM_07670 [Ignicoccus islandicus DSM 13165]|uniref:Uncharacterized protein n=1 Tax=Ignicoccus islandicus DSM 13165 TaxID=940295 RepID=A0A0U2VFM7_9CREN|nr:hypothetical protein [Ignicoccus islandicus]ALU12802.1 hypothetical protein EYM_07670 [Ignicoccus islandicus DSM 13165]